ncbi:maleate cis-trans isomerase family protein [Halovivax limisalsi]|uniref:maleate cis-trans isomerase family protein n=1 Tax=Halovivax limisalsi TaxID=1453760 RepID=UPI001FFC3610|nr:maleate cis-trans isomerase [Halovivax limisalsi]
MYGWRARAGLIVPSVNSTAETELGPRMPDGVSSHVSRMYLEDGTVDHLEKMAGEAEESASLLGTADVDVIAYTCTAGSLHEGLGFDEQLESELSEAAGGVPTVATAASIKRAFDALGLERLSVTAPYIDDLNDLEVEFLEASGYDVTNMNGLGIKSGLEIGAQKQEDTYRTVREADHSGADAVFISCTNLPTLDIIEKLEADLGMPVLSSNQATLWDVMQNLPVSPEEPVGPGTLFEET